MNEQRVTSEDFSVAPATKAEFPSGIRLGLGGSLDADDMARRALGSFNKREAKESPEDYPRASFVIPGSFQFKKTDGATFYIYGGKIKWAGHGSATIPDDTHVLITYGGTSYVSLKIPWNGFPSGWSLVNTSNEPEDDGEFFYHVLYEVTSPGDEMTCSVVKDLRTDFVMRSPL